MKPEESVHQFKESFLKELSDYGKVSNVALTVDNSCDDRVVYLSFMFGLKSRDTDSILYADVEMVIQEEYNELWYLTIVVSEDFSCENLTALSLLNQFNANTSITTKCYYKDGFLTCLQTWFADLFVFDTALFVKVMQAFVDLCDKLKECRGETQ